MLDEEEGYWRRHAIGSLLTNYVEEEEEIVEADTGITRKVGNYYEGKRLPVWKTKEKDVVPKGKVLGAVQMLRDAASKGASDALQQCKTLVVDWKLNPNLRDEKGSTALHAAAKSNSQEIAKFLCDVQADVNALSKTKSTPLMKAAEARHADLVSLLLEHRADINRQNDGRATALMLAVVNRAEKVVTLLIKQRAELDLRKDVGSTALMLAARVGNAGAVADLVQANASIELKDKRGETALWKAERNKKQEAARVLFEHGAVPRPGGVLARQRAKNASFAESFAQRVGADSFLAKSPAAALPPPPPSSGLKKRTGGPAPLEEPRLLSPSPSCASVDTSVYSSATDDSACSSPTSSRRAAKATPRSRSQPAPSSARGRFPADEARLGIAASPLAIEVLAGDRPRRERDAAWHAKWDDMQASIDEVAVDDGPGAPLAAKFASSPLPAPPPAPARRSSGSPGRRGGLKKAS